MTMTRRHLLSLLGYAGFAGKAHAVESAPAGDAIGRLELSDALWKQRLSPAQYDVLRREGTERAFTSPLNAEKRKGRFLCAGCDLPLFASDMKYDSGTGWPSFFAALPGTLRTRTDFKLLLPRTEYHSARVAAATKAMSSPMVRHRPASATATTAWP